MYPAAYACLLPDPVTTLQPPPFFDSYLEKVYTNHYYPMTPCITEIQHTPPGTLWGTHIITQGNNTYSVPPPHISVQQEPNMLGEMYNVLQQMKTESDRLVESTRKHTPGLADVLQDHRSDRSSV
jgi:hypothetical protein